MQLQISLERKSHEDFRKKLLNKIHTHITKLEQISSSQLSNNWQNTLTIALIGGLLFLLISFLISREIRLQVLSINELREQATSANRAKSNFLSTMSHEIRTPMNAVLGMTELMEDTNLSDEQKDFVKTISSSGNNLLDIINNILDFSKLDEDMTEIESIQFNLERVCHESIELIAGNSKDKNLEFVFDFHPDCPQYFIGDPTRLRQILINLIGNAVKFTDTGFIRLGVSFNATPVGNEQLSIEVQDTGIGLKPEAIKTLFEAFTQADNTTTRKHGGTGLGLAITKKLVSLMGLTIDIDSTFGEGTIFRIVGNLPVATISRKQISRSLKDVRMLFVDDNQENRIILKRILQHMGAEIITEEKPERVISLLNEAAELKKPFQIVILDYNMPNISGLELGTIIRENSVFNSIKLLIFSSVGLKGDAAIFTKAGFNGYLNKPCRYNLLHEVLSGMLEAKSSDVMITQHSIEDAKQTSENISKKFSHSILLVDDVLANLFIAKKFLTSMGLDITTANNGKEAVDFFNSNQYDLILMDCRMPIMDGYEATRTIRQIEKTSNAKAIPIIALTANALEEDKITCQLAGMDDIVTKPFKRIDLSDCLEKWLR